jgi:outer membrane lipoprotein-sorting protein
MRTVTLVTYATVLLGVAAGAAQAATPKVAVIERQMKAALEPARPSTRRFDMVIRSPEGDVTRWMARQARKHLPDGNRILTVMLAPDTVRGVALLIKERPGRSDVQWLYLPSVRRVRKLLEPTRFESFLGTDFTYADLGFVNLSFSRFTLLGVGPYRGKHAYEVQEVPRNRWYYSRIVTWIATDSMLPLERDYYDPTGALWKTEYFENVTVIDGVPTPLRVRMVDNEEGGSTELDVSKVRYDIQIPDALFAPDHLRAVATHPFWATLGK